MQYFALAAFAASATAWDLSPETANVWQGHTGADARGGLYSFNDDSGNTWSNGTGSCVINNVAEWADAELFSTGAFHVNFNNGAINLFNLREEEVTAFDLLVLGSDSETPYSNSTADYASAISCDNSIGLSEGDLVLGNFPNHLQEADDAGFVSGRGNIAAFGGVWPASFSMLWPGQADVAFDDERVISEAIADVDGGFTVIADTVASNELWFNYTVDAASFRGSWEINLA
jgi:hypothetical protein